MVQKGMEHPKIGIALIVHDGNGRVLMGIRKKQGPGFGKWQFPGGHLEMYEDFETCAKRETLEEVGIEVEDVFYLDLTNNPWPNHRMHYVTIFLVARHKSGTPKQMEPDKCEDWIWHSLDRMPPQKELFESATILNAANIEKILSHSRP
jgi:8-oxo-dGTP diphosphatase